MRKNRNIAVSIMIVGMSLLKVVLWGEINNKNGIIEV